MARVRRVEAAAEKADARALQPCASIRPSTRATGTAYDGGRGGSRMGEFEASRGCGDGRPDRPRRRAQGGRAGADGIRTSEIASIAARRCRAIIAIAAGRRRMSTASLGAFVHDLLHGVFHFEGKIWRTLPLLAWRPGELTRRYIDGERARFVSPIALFLFIVFLMFAVIGALDRRARRHRVTRPDRSRRSARSRRKWHAGTGASHRRSPSSRPTAPSCQRRPADRRGSTTGFADARAEIRRLGIAKRRQRRIRLDASVGRHARSG